MNPPKEVIVILGKISRKHFSGVDSEKRGRGRVNDSCLQWGMD